MSEEMWLFVTENTGMLLRISTSSFLPTSSQAYLIQKIIIIRKKCIIDAEAAQLKRC